MSQSRRLRGVAENAGVVVALFPLSRRVDAFSVGRRRPIIVLNSDDPPSRSVWNVAHELGHLILHRRSTLDRRHLEEEADKFAAALLLPAQAFSLSS